MEWTAFTNADGTLKNVRPGPSYRGQQKGEQFKVEAPTFQKAWEKAEEFLKNRPLPPRHPPLPYRHPAFLPSGGPSKTRLVCPCGAPLGPRELNCAVCRRDMELVVLRRKTISQIEDRVCQPNEAHLRILLEVREAWMACPNIGVFSRWLNEQVEQLERTAIKVSMDLEPALV